jgi:hypothetical protein
MIYDRENKIGLVNLSKGAMGGGRKKENVRMKNIETIYI